MTALTNVHDLRLFRNFISLCAGRIGQLLNLSKLANYFDIYEIKSTQTILPKLFKGMDYFSEITKGKVKMRTLVYGGNDSHERTEYLVRRWYDL